MRAMAKGWLLTLCCFAGMAAMIGHSAARYALHQQFASPGRSTLGIDGARKLLAEGFKRRWPPLIRMDAVARATLVEV